MKPLPDINEINWDEYEKNLLKAQLEKATNPTLPIPTSGGNKCACGHTPECVYKQTCKFFVLILDK